MPVYNEVKLISKKFEESLKVFAEQKPGLTKVSEIAKYEKHWKKIDTLAGLPVSTGEIEVLEFFRGQEVERHFVITLNGASICDL